ncbi:MAG: adenosine deaminase [Anaerolineales bacterium]
MQQTSNHPEQDLHLLPKIDLHRHLEGSIPIDVVQRLVSQGQVPLPSDRDQLLQKLTVGPSDPRTPSNFLAPFSALRKVFQNESVIREVAVSAVRAAAEDNIRYLELHLTPAALAAESGGSAEDVTRWVCEAGRQAAEDLPMNLRFIVSLNRHEPLEVAENSVRAATDLSDMGIVGVDLAGDETNYSAAPFISLMKEARAAGMNLSIHAGEWAGADSVRFALDHLEADRIVHGVRSMEDPELVRMARDRRVPFIVCLTSNLQSGVVDSIGDHPLPMMIAAGIQVSLGTDDPSVSQTSLTREYELARRHLQLGFDSLRGSILSGAQAAFLPQKQRHQLEEQYQRWLGLAPDTEPTVPQQGKGMGG